MKTGFIQGFVNLMKPKTYPYHGILNQCGIQPEIPPYIGPDMKPPGQEWVLVFEGSIYTAWRSYMRFQPSGFLESSDPHPCSQKTYCDHNVYYFVEAYVYKRGPGELLNITWADGVNCKHTWISSYDAYYIYKAWFNYQWGASKYVWWVFNTGPSSYARMWKSLTGEFPGYYPMPQKEIIRV